MYDEEIDNYDWRALVITSSGEVADVDNNIGYRPVVYLDSDVVITSGNGEENNQYEIE